MFQPKYSMNVLKMFALTTLSGFIISLSGTHEGTDSDINIYRETGLDLLQRDYRFLADGAFVSQDCQKTICPLNRTQIVTVKTGRGETDRDKECKIEANLRYCALISFYRSRIEHRFSRTELNRFRGLHGWLHAPELLRDAIVAVFSALNAEKLHRWGFDGVYRTVDEAEALRVYKITKKHAMIRKTKKIDRQPIHLTEAELRKHCSHIYTDEMLDAIIRNQAVNEY